MGLTVNQWLEGFDSLTRSQNLAPLVLVVKHRFCNPRSGVRFTPGAPQFGDWESLVNPSALGAEERRFESFISDHIIVHTLPRRVGPWTIFFNLKET